MPSNDTTPHPNPNGPLPYSPGREIRVTFVVTDGAELVDLAGPWGVFEYARTPAGYATPFRLATVAGTTSPIVLSGGLTVVPTHSFEDAPDPDLVVVPALDLDSLTPELLDWVTQAHAGADLTMSVCNGAFVLAEAELLAGRSATCHHGAYGSLQAQFPDITVVRGARYVEDGPVATSGGLTCGIDLALRVVERYLGTDEAARTAERLEHQGHGWQHPLADATFARAPEWTPGSLLDPVCEHVVDPTGSVTATWRGATVHFCGEWCRDVFLQGPERFVTP